ncbi:MAG: hypothetical protein ACMUHX_10540 [bacterium]
MNNPNNKYRDVKFDPLHTIFDFLVKEKWSKEEREDIDTAIKDMEAFQNEDKKTRETKNRLMNSYWRLIFLVIQRALEKEDMERLYFNEYDALLINFGIFSHRLLSSSNNMVKNFLTELKSPFESEELKTYYLTEWLQVLYKNKLGIKYREQLQKQQEGFGEEFNNKIKELEYMMNERENILNYLHNQELNNILQRIDKLAQSQAELKTKMQSGEYTTPEQKKMNALAIEALWALKDERDKFIDEIEDFNLKKHLREINMKIEHHFIDSIEVRHKRNKLDEKINKYDGDMSEISYEKRKLFLEDEAKRIRMYCQVCARRAKADLFPILIDETMFNFKMKVFQVINNIERSDPKIFKNVIVRRQGRPGMLVIPGKGYGVYDWEHNLLVIPLISPKSPVESIVHALVEYRWDVDEAGDLKGSYEKLNKNKNLFTSQIRDNFFKDYILWITRECQGYKILDKDVREWFQWKIAPSKEDEISESQAKTN